MAHLIGWRGYSAAGMFEATTFSVVLIYESVIAHQLDILAKLL